MTTTGVETGVWHPTIESERRLVRLQLEKMVNDGRFVASKRYPQLLRYIVEQTLAGNEENLKERTLGVEVFHRAPDYDTNLDPVVRLCAAEVRKRIAQYYQSPGHDGELRIELNPGSYIPVFSKPAVDSPNRETIAESPIPVFSQPTPEALALEVTLSDVPSNAEPVMRRTQTTKFFWLAGWIAAGTLIVGLLVLGVRYKRHFWGQESALDEVWSPLLASRKPVLFCVGESELFAPPDSPLTMLQKGADDDSFHQAFPDRNDFVPLSDVQILSRFVALIGSHRHAFKVQDSRMTVSSQLREGPVVLIGALNNDWTLNRTSSLRFHLAGPDGPMSLMQLQQTGKTADPEVSIPILH